MRKIKLYLTSKQYVEINKFLERFEDMRISDVFCRSLEWYFYCVYYSAMRLELDKSIIIEKARRPYKEYIYIKEFWFQKLTIFADYRLQMSRPKTLLLIVLTFIKKFDKIAKFYEEPVHVCKPNITEINKLFGVDLKIGNL